MAHICKVTQQDDLDADIVGVIIAKALLKIGSPVCEGVSQMLRGQNATFADCYKHPKLLNTILIQFFGKGYKSVLEEIKKESSGLFFFFPM
jgi:hypothetical protein